MPFKIYSIPIILVRSPLAPFQSPLLTPSNPLSFLNFIFLHFTKVKLIYKELQVLNVHNLMSVNLATAHDTITTIKVISNISQSFLVSLGFSLV